MNISDVWCVVALLRCGIMKSMNQKINFQFFAFESTPYTHENGFSYGFFIQPKNFHLV